MVQVLRAAERPASPWRNGNGVTWQVASSPPEADADAFEWRISVAEVASDAEFSAFPGVERTIAVIEGDGVELIVEGACHVLRPFEPFAFRGDALTSCRLIAGMTRDLNLMTRSDRPAGSMKFVTVEGELAVEADCILVAEGSARVDSIDLGRLDAALLSEPALVEAAHAVLALITTPPSLITAEPPE